MVNRKCEKRDKRCFLGFCFFSKREKSVHRKLFRNVNNNNSNNDNGNNSESDEEKSVSGTFACWTTMTTIWVQYIFEESDEQQQQQKIIESNNKKNVKEKGKKDMGGQQNKQQGNCHAFRTCIMWHKVENPFADSRFAFCLFAHPFAFPSLIPSRSALRPSSSLCSSTGFADRSHSFSHVVHCVCPMSRKNFHFQF